MPQKTKKPDYGRVICDLKTSILQFKLFMFRKMEF